MRLALSSLLAGMVLVGASGAVVAQDTIVIAPEQETIIREYVDREPVASINLPGIELNVGSVLPEETEVRVIEAPELDTKYEYVVVDNRTIILEPGTRRIVRVLD